MEIIVKATKQYPYPAAGEHTAVVANAVFLPNNPSFNGAIRDEIQFIYYLTDEFTDQDKPFRIWKNITTEPGRGANFPVFMDALGVKPINGLWKVDVKDLIGVNCRLTLYHDRTAAGIIKAKIVKYGIAAPLPGAVKYVIPPAFCLTGRTDSNAPGGFQSTMQSPADDFEVRTPPASPPRYSSIEAMKAAAGILPTPAVADPEASIAAAVAAARAKRAKGHESFTTGGNATAEEVDFPLQ
jgi:hypothetical protein